MRHIRLMSALMICALAAPTLGLRCGGSGSGDADGDGDSDRPPWGAGHACPVEDRGNWLELDVFIQHDDPRECPMTVEYHGQGRTLALTLMASPAVVDPQSYAVYQLANSLGVPTQGYQARWTEDAGVARVQIWDDFRFGHGPPRSNRYGYA